MNTTQAMKERERVIRDLQRMTPRQPDTLANLLGTPRPSRGQAETYLRLLLPQLADQMPWADDRDTQRVHFNQAGRIVSVVLQREVDQSAVDAALEACGAIYDLRMGGCLTHMYGYANTDENRDFWLSYERQNLTNAIRDLTSAIPEKVTP
jgi:hypothetical protein